MGKLIKKENEENIYLMMNKPSGYLTARSDDKDETIFDLLPDNLKESYTLFPVGRLDKDTEGLILLTNDGLFNHKVIHKDANIKKIYEFYALGKLDKEKLKDLKEGIILEDTKEKVKTKPFKVRTLKRYKFKDAKKVLPEVSWRRLKKKQRDDADMFKGEITIFEGKKHEVKRILKGLGCYVLYLERVQIGNLKLNKKLKRGDIKILNEKDLKKINA